MAAEEEGRKVMSEKVGFGPRCSLGVIESALEVAVGILRSWLCAVIETRGMQLWKKVEVASVGVQLIVSCVNSSNFQANLVGAVVFVQ